MSGSETAAVIPVYNNDWSIRGTVYRVADYLSLKNIIVVNDGSTDKTADVLRDIPEIKVVFLEKNLGKGRALEAGFKAAVDAGYEWIITMDGDGQHSPDDLPQFLDVHEEEIYLGKRDIRIGKMPFFRVLSNKITSFILSRITGQKILDSQCGFRKIKAEVVRNIQVKSGRFQFESELLILAAGKGYKIDHVPIRTLYNSRKSSMKHFLDTCEFIRMVFGYMFKRK
jgi:glycosyltransferase involved in cell wall biosynthesis